MAKAMPARVTTYTMPSPYPALAIALVADLHNTDPSQTLRLLEKEKPDLIVIAGDLYEGPPRRERVEWEHAARLLKACGELAPTYYSQGNHDQTLCAEIEAAIKEAGVTLLTDRAVYAHGIHIGGLGSAYYQEDDTPNLAFAIDFSHREGYKLLICHHPEYYRRYLKDLPLDLILSGHNHGGQWRVFGRGVYVPGQGLFPPHTHGVIDGRLVVSCGVSNNVWVPRIGVPTELVMLRPQV